MTQSQNAEWNGLGDLKHIMKLRTLLLLGNLAKYLVISEYYSIHLQVVDFDTAENGPPKGLQISPLKRP